MERERVEIYGECHVCRKWDDLSIWRDIAHLCSSCAPKVEYWAPIIQGRYKTNNQDTFNRVKQQLIGGSRWQNIRID